MLPRLARHFLPERLVRGLLLRGWIIKASLESSMPETAADRYLEVLAAPNLSGKRVMVFGYGGRFDIGLGLLDRGAQHVTLCDKYAPPDDRHNMRLVESHPAYLSAEGRRVRPRSEAMTLLQADIRDAAADAKPAYDVVVSNSVYEHLDDVEGITRALARLTVADGIHAHFVDLRDHFFKYPFEMLCYSERAWRGWLNPSSNHNRFRLWDYQRVFEKCFEQVDIEVLERDERAFAAARPRIRPEFLSGDDEQDSVTVIRVLARRPRRL